MKIIISHDIDHLYPSDHFFKDLIFQKLWIRSSILLYKGKISFASWFYRLISIFDKRLNQIPEIITFDKTNGVKSTFFFGMANILGMSYNKERAQKWIKLVLEEGFDAGVHGVEIDDIDKMQQEYNDFKNISGISDFGIRTHYVRYNETTFDKMAKIGYLFDTSEFNKKEVELKPFYKIGNMWEFPLHIMDGYIMKDDLYLAQQKTIEVLDSAEKANLHILTFLFHDCMYNGKTYPNDKEYYEWFVSICKQRGYEFISYKNCIKSII